MTTIVSKKVTFNRKNGLHARTAGQLSAEMRSFEAQCQVTYRNKAARMSSILEMLVLCVDKGAELDILCEGPDAQKALEAIENFAKDNS